jgi:hypothetical protein
MFSSSDQYFDTIIFLISFTLFGMLFLGLMWGLISSLKPLKGIISCLKDIKGILEGQSRGKTVI